MIDLASAIHANEHVVPAIYEAATTPERWNSALELVTEFVDCSRGFVTLSYLSGRRGQVVASIGFPDEMLASWEQKYSVNDWVLLAASLEPGDLLHAAESVPVEQLLATPMGQEILAPLDIRDGIGVKMSDSPLFVGALSAYSEATVQEASLDHLRFLAPHLARGLALYQRMVVQLERTSALERSVDSLSTGIILLSRTAEVLYANASATQMLEDNDGLRLRDDRLAFYDPKVARDLTDAVEQALAEGPQHVADRHPWVL